MDEVANTSAKPRARPGPKPGQRKVVKIEVTGYEVGRGRTKRIVIDEDVYKLAQLGCTDKEIANWFDMTESTLRYNFKGILAKGRAELQQRLRMAQIKLALDGNAVMLIFLGKQLLGQRSEPLDTENTRILPFTDDDDDTVDDANIVDI